MNISNPATGAQKLIDVEDEKKLRPFMDKRISQEVDAGTLGNEWKVKIVYYLDLFGYIHFKKDKYILFKYIFAFFL